MGVNCSQSVPVYVTQRCGSLWVVVDRCGIVVGRCGSLWIVVGRCGSFRVLVTTVSEWRFLLVKSCICSFILSCFWQPYECVTGLSTVFWVVVSRYVCYSVCFSIFGKNSKVKFLIFFSWVVSFVLGSLWVVLRSSPVVWRSLWIVVGRCGSFRVLVTTVLKQCKPYDSISNKCNLCLFEKICNHL